MISAEILKHVRRIEITTSHLVEDLLGGEYQSVFKGQGMEFADVREYVPGDDIRSIDWNVTARCDRPFVKQFVEERELTVAFLVDGSSSCGFGTQEKTKAEIIAETCALLAFAAVKNHDKVGISFFTDRVEKYIPTKKGRSHVLRVIREILSFKPEHQETKFEQGFEFINQVMRRRAVVFLVSDFIGLPANSRAFQILSKKHDVIAIRIRDPREREIPNVGLIELEDAESGEMLLVNTGSRRMREQYKTKAAARDKKIEQIFKKQGVDMIDIRTESSYVDPIVKFFRMREKKAR